MKKSKLKKIIFTSMAFALIFAMTACNNSEQKAEEKKDSITMAVSEDISDLNAHLYNGSMLAQDMIFESLVRNTEKGPEPALAESWEISEDGKTYTFKLRKDVKFTDGEPFDAKAAKANFDAIQENKETHSWLELSNKIVGCDVVDEHTIALKLSDAYYPTLAELGLTRPYRMMSPKVFENGKTKDGVTDIVGTGPYKLKEHVTDQYASFEANDDYWNGKPSIKNITMKVMPSGETPLLALKKGEINFLFSTDTSGMIDADALKTLESDDKYKVHISKPCSTRYMLTNSDPSRIISDKNIKQAVWQSINKEELCNGVFSNFEKPASTIFAKSVPYCDVELKDRKFDEEASKKLIEKSGWTFDSNSGFYKKDGKTLVLELVYNSDKTMNKVIAEFIQANTKNVGIDLKLVAVEGNVMRDLRSQGKYDLYLDRSWGLPYDPQSTITALFSKQSFLTVTKDLNSFDEMHKTILDAMTTTDESTRKDLFKKELGFIHDEMCFIPLSYSSAIIVADKELGGVEFNQSQFEVPFYKFAY
ncbi:nickel transport system substrate-binding protein [Peptostreptococcaceae bacterium pGA-8]|nr:nickel transport system substrate-binding protein [Peptostreptococcaceae bacterium pGA-8]